MSLPPPVTEHFRHEVDDRPPGRLAERAVPVRGERPAVYTNLPQLLDFAREDPGPPGRYEDPGQRGQDAYGLLRRLIDDGA